LLCCDLQCYNSSKKITLKRERLLSLLYFNKKQQTFEQKKRLLLKKQLNRDISLTFSFLIARKD